MKLKSYLYNSTSNSLGFSGKNSLAWVSPEVYKELLPNRNDDVPHYVKIECKELLCKFSLYVKIEQLNTANNLEEGFIWIPREIIPERNQVDKGTILEVTFLDQNNIKAADSITIKLNPSEVKKWSQDEIEKAENIFRSKIDVSFVEQRLFIDPMTKDIVMGEVVSILPKSREICTPYQVTPNTRIHFEGLPADKQKTIDFSQIGGLSHVIEKLREIIQIPLVCPEYLDKFGVKVPKGILLYGPPGNGKTMIARAVAHSMGTAFQAIEGTEIMSKYYGDAEKELKRKFQEVISRGGGIIFIDEIDSLASLRQEDSSEALVSIVATLLTQMDGINSSDKVLVIGATNRLNSVDPALRRPGRFDLEFEIPLPNIDDRKDILSKYVHIEKKDCFDSSVSSESLAMIAEQTNGYSGADIKSLYREACMNAIRKCISWNKETGKIEITSKKEDVKVSFSDFENAKKVIVPTSLRATGLNDQTVQWDKIVGLDDIKSKLEEFNKKMVFLINRNSIFSRPSFGNILLVGDRHTGKQTCVMSFAQKFGYEALYVDFLELDAKSNLEALNYIETIFRKACQVEPAIILINDSDSSCKNLYLSKIEDEIEKINKRSNVFVFFSTENISITENSIIDRVFSNTLNFNISRDVITTSLCNKYPNEIIPNYKQIGRCISYIEEQLALNHLNDESIS